jgi:hypothetical protein
LTALGAPEAFYFGETYMALDLQHQGGPTYQVANATVRRGGTGTISNAPPPAGWTTSEGSLIGGSTFFARDFPMVWWQPWDVKAGLVAWAYGTADSNFLSTARLTGLTLYDANHDLVSEFSLSATSGTDYIGAVPEPQTWALWLFGLALLGGRAAHRSSFAMATGVQAAQPRRAQRVSGQVTGDRRQLTGDGARRVASRALPAQGRVK